MKEEQNRFLTAVILSGLILFSWQYFYGSKESVNNKVSTTQTQENLNSETTNKSSDISQNALDNESAVSTKISSEKSFLISNAETSVRISDQFEIISAKHENVDASENFQTKTKLAQTKFVVNEKEQTLTFNVQQINNQTLKLVNDAISFNVLLNENGKLNFKTINNNGVERLNFYTFGKELSDNSAQFSNFSYFSDELVQEKISQRDEPAKYSGKLDWAALDYKYYLLGNSFLNNQGSTLYVHSNYLKVSTSNFDEFNFFFIKKTYDKLLNMGENLHMSVDLGFFSFLAIPILRGLQYIYRQVPNYGIAIIILTLFIRLITSPLQFISSRSMKKMQVIQPELTRLREKYKDNPQRMQQETMALFKKSGANPMSGCFPLILQMPIFFAFYKVLYGAVELMGAPFYGWIQDLSTKDPYYFLPVLVALGMFLQQKIMPTTTTDPTQKKVMMFLPLIFGFIMKDLPSGLNLYIFVSTMFGILQQYVIMKTVKV